MSSLSPAPHLAESKPLTFVDHIVNIFRLVIKELKKHPRGPGDADPRRLRLQHLGQHGRHRLVAGSDQSFGQHRRRGQLRICLRRIAEGLQASDVPAPGAHQRFRDRPEDGQGRAAVRRRDPAQLQIRHPRSTEDGDPDPTPMRPRSLQAGNGAGYLRTAIANEIRRFISGREDSSGAPVNLVMRAAFNPDLKTAWFSGDDAGHQPDYDADRHFDGRCAHPRARAGHGRASSGPCLSYRWRSCWRR